jgi:hypothetical protein
VHDANRDMGWEGPLLTEMVERDDGVIVQHDDPVVASSRERRISNPKCNLNPGVSLGDCSRRRWSETTESSSSMMTQL